MIPAFPGCCTVSTSSSLDIAGAKERTTSPRGTFEAFTIFGELEMTLAVNRSNQSGTCIERSMLSWNCPGIPSAPIPGAVCTPGGPAGATPGCIGVCPEAEG